jgi:RNA polymerase sigma-70 factor (ECF subfamily)
MDEDKDYIELVEQAQLGKRESLDTLAELVRGRLYAYVYRIVLQEDLAQDIVQESMFEMFKVLGKLERADRFWPWLRGIAFNKMRRHYVEKKNRIAVQISKQESTQHVGTEEQTGLANLVAEELKQVVIGAMGELKPQYRKVLTMRCYEGMEYPEIAELMGCSELGARVLFCRAKRALQKRLSHKGFGRGFLVTALMLFGKITAPNEAAAAGVSVTAATCKAGAAAGLLAAAGSKTTIVSLTAAGVLTVGGVVATSSLDRTTEVAGSNPAGSIPVVSQTVPAQGGAEECWYYYPRSVDGPVMLRLVKWDSEGKESYCKWWQDDRANYYFEKSRNTIYINNYRMWDSGLSVRRLPADGVNMVDFLSMVEGKGDEMEYVSGRGEGLLVIARKGGDDQSNRLRIIRHYNVLDEEYFRYQWPPGAKVVDNRDAMHKRGWTYFKITGQVYGKEVEGKGRIPFVYTASGRDWPWLELKVGGSVVSEACFGGLGRPWMGLHTIDTVRRDAAKERIWFETRYDKRGGKAEVLLRPSAGQIVYTVDMEKDVIEQITFSTSDGREGELKFSYLDDVDEAGSEFAEPGRRASMREKNDGMLWLVRLMEGKLGQ